MVVSVADDDKANKETIKHWLPLNVFRRSKCPDSQAMGNHTHTHVISTVTNHAFRLFDIDALIYRFQRGRSFGPFVTTTPQKLPSSLETASGSSSTNMAIRHVVYPSYGSATDTGVIIVSYTWAMDAEMTEGPSTCVYRETGP